VICMLTCLSIYMLSGFPLILFSFFISFPPVNQVWVWEGASQRGLGRNSIPKVLRLFARVSTSQKNRITNFFALTKLGGILR